MYILPTVRSIFNRVDGVIDIPLIDKGANDLFIDEEVGREGGRKEDDEVEDEEEDDEGSIST